MTPIMHHILFDMPFVRILPCILVTWKLQDIHVYGHFAYQMTAVISETFLVYFRVAWVIELESYHPRYISRLFSDAIMSCIYCKLVYTVYIATCIWCASMHNHKTHIAYNCTVHQMMALLPMMHRFIRTNSASWSIHVTVSYQLRWTL